MYKRQGYTFWNVLYVSFRSIDSWLDGLLLIALLMKMLLPSVEAENHTGVFWVLGVVGSSMLPSVSLLIIVFQTRSHDMPTPPLSLIHIW